MLSHLKESTLFAWKAVATFFIFFLFAIVAVSDWLKGFPLLDKWCYSFLLPKVMVILVGYLVTSIPLWALVLLSFIPVPVIAPIYFVAFIIALAHF